MCLNRPAANGKAFLGKAVEADERPSASGRHLPANRAPHLAWSGQRGRRRQATVPRRGRRAGAPFTPALPQPSRPLRRSTPGTQPDLRPEKPSWRPGHHSHAPAPKPHTPPSAVPVSSTSGHLASPRRSRSAPLPDVPASRSDRLPGRERRLRAWDDAGFTRPASPLPSRSGFGPTAAKRSGRGADR